MKSYIRPQAHHWVVLRLIRAYSRGRLPYTQDHARSLIWLMREVGQTQLNEMLDQLAFEDQHR